MGEPTSHELHPEDAMTQKSLYALYATYVSQAKADFFKSLGLPIVQGKREGVYIHALEGIRRNQSPLQLIDCRTSGGVFNFGHRHPQILQALQEGLAAGLDIGDHHLVSAQRALLAKQLGDLLPGDLKKTQFCVSGGEAIDLAIKLSMAATKRTTIVSAKKAYHGVTGLALGAGDPKFRTPFFWSPSNYKQVDFGNLAAFDQITDEQTAAVILETIPATGGIQIAPPGFFKGIREICDQKGILLIADEVQAGLGRTGQLWGIYGGIYPEEKIIPDIIVLAKGLSAGIYPLATCTYRPFIDKVFEEDPFLHISTTGGSELGCYITRKMLDLLTEPSFLATVRERSLQMEKGLRTLQQKYAHLIREVRGRGLMWGIELPNDRYGLGFTLQMIQNGVFADYCGNDPKTVKLMPPLIISPEELNETMRRLDKAMSQLPPLKPGSENKDV